MLSFSMLETARSSNSFAPATSTGEQLFQLLLSHVAFQQCRAKNVMALPGLGLRVRQSRLLSSPQQKSLLAKAPSNSAAACIKPGNVLFLVDPGPTWAQVMREMLPRS